MFHVRLTIEKEKKIPRIEILYIWQQYMWYKNDQSL